MAGTPAVPPGRITPAKHHIGQPVPGTHEQPEVGWCSSRPAAESLGTNPSTSTPSSTAAPLRARLASRDRMTLPARARATVTVPTRVASRRRAAPHVEGLH
jgi:hypothetical protein